MRPTISQYAKSLEELSQGKTEADIVLLVQHFFAFLKRRKEGKKIRSIIECLEKMQDKKDGVQVVKATLAREADEVTKAQIMKEAEKVFPEKKIILTYTIDKNIIGGVCLRTDEVLYDATLSHTLTYIKQSFLKA